MDRKKYVVYGAGNCGAAFNLQDKIEQYSMCAYCDADPEKEGKTLNGFPIVGRKNLREYCIKNDIKIVAVAIYNENLKQQIEEELSTELGDLVAVQGCTEFYFDNCEEWRELQKALNSKLSEHELDAIFFESCYFYFFDSGKALIDYYLEQGKRCILVFPSFISPEWLFSGKENMLRIYSAVMSYRKRGVECIALSNEELLKCTSHLCFNMGYDMNYIPYYLNFGDNARNVIVQSTPFRSHYYYRNLPGEDVAVQDVFDDALYKNIDYYVGSEYQCDWIAKKCPQWKNKMVKVGYPRMDDLYRALKENAYIPEEWSKRIGEKKVFFSAVIDVAPHLKYFPKDNGSRIMIWRPHPLKLMFHDYMELLRSYELKYEVIIDTRPDYYASCYASDALISDMEVSLNLNYLFCRKPIILDMTTNNNPKGDYEEQPWFKAMYKAYDADEVGRFIEMIERGEDYDREKLQHYRDYMQQGFDGYVCERIYRFMNT